MSRIFCIVGKSSTGKDTLYKKIVAKADKNLVPLVPYTTRPMRIGEIDGVDYNFVTVEQLEKFEEEKLVIERRQYITTQGPWNYFTLKFDVDEKKDYILINTLEGALSLIEHYGADLLHVVYLDVDDKIILLRYIERESKQEKPDYAEVCRRFIADKKDFSEDKLSLIKNLHRIDAGKTPESCFEAWEKIYKSK